MWVILFKELRLQYGKFYPYPILEIKDSSKFNFSYKYSKNIYSYRLSLEPDHIRTQGFMQAAMQRDLE